MVALLTMKTTIDIPDEVYRQVKARSAIEGRSVRDVTIGLFRGWVGDPGRTASPAAAEPGEIDGQPVPPWFGVLRRYAPNAGGRHDLESIRQSIARGRAQEGQGGDVRTRHVCGPPHQPTFGARGSRSEPPAPITRATTPARVKAGAKEWAVSARRPPT